MVYYNINEYDFERFENSDNKNKKYDAILKNKHTNKYVRVPFGSRSYEQYKDITGLNLYSNKNHLDDKRRNAYQARHKHFIKPGYFSPGYFSFYFLW